MSRVIELSVGGARRFTVVDMAAELLPFISEIHKSSQCHVHI